MRENLVGKRELALALLVLVVASLAIPASYLLVPRARAASYYGPPLSGKYLGELPPSAEVSVSVLIPPRNVNLLFLVAQEVSNHQARPLSRSQVLQLFAPSEKEFDEVVDYLKSEGFAIVYTSPDRLSVMAEAPASVVESVFGVKLGLYEAADGTVYYAPEGTPEIPPELQGTIILGLTNRTSFRPQYIVAGKIDHYVFTPAFQSALGISSPMQVFGAYTYYTPADFEGAYNVTPIMQYSQGASIAIIDAYGDPLIQQDVLTFDQMFGLPPVNLTIIPIGPYHPSLGLETGWYIETALDVEAAQSMAPYAHIYLVVASNANNALFEAIDYVVSTDLADVVSMSWGLPENLWGTSGVYTTYPAFYFNYPFADYYFALGAAEGISFFAASGDEGAFDATPTTYGAVLFPSSSPFVTAVGGTSLYVNVTSGSLEFLNSTATYGYETAWSVNPLYGIEVASTGGYSSFFPKPWYQFGVVQGNYRATPDVAADANPYTGFVTIAAGETLIIGGTSLATPLWAGIAADVDGYLGMKLGLLNPILYEIYRQPSLYSKAFHQVTFGYNGLYLAHEGFNLVTGLGSPNAGELAAAIAQVLATSKELEISVTTYQPGAEYAWYMYNTSFYVEAVITFPNETPVTAGAFDAYVYTTQGLLEEVPLEYNSTLNMWVGEVYVKTGTPPNVWTIVVNGTSGKYSGTGATDAYIGVGLTIVEPVPYPYAPSIPVNTPFTVEAYAIYPNGTPAEVPSLEAVFYHDGVPVFTATLLPVSGTPGLYEGTAMLAYPEPQGAYVMYVYSEAPNGKVDGAAYEYVYFGEEVVVGYVLTPLNDGLPSVSANQTVVFLAQVMNPWGLGEFTSQVWVDIYNLSGHLVAQVPLQPAPYPLLGYQIGYFTVPPTMQPGWYNAVFVSYENTSTGPLFGYLNQSFYVVPYQLSAKLYVASYALQGQWLEVYAVIRYPNGTPATMGTFTLSLVPAQLLSDSLYLSFYYGVPLQYDSALGEWVGEIYVPSVMAEGIYQSYAWGAYGIAGPWYVLVGGESPEGLNLYTMGQEVYVSPYPVTPLPFAINESQLQALAGEAAAMQSSAPSSAQLAKMVGSVEALSAKAAAVASAISAASDEPAPAPAVAAPPSATGSAAPARQTAKVAGSLSDYLAIASLTLSAVAVAAALSSRRR